MNINASFPRVSSRRHREDGIAIILVLAFIVILTGLVFAFFSRALTERQVANSSLNQGKADLFARSAVDVIVGDFKQEIVNGSSPSPTAYPAYPLYVPTSNKYMVPQASGTPSPSPSNSPFPVPNLLRRSVRNDPLAQGTTRMVTTSASAVNSYGDLVGNQFAFTPSVNGRYVGLARWNSHFLIPLANPNPAFPAIDSTPISPFPATPTGAPAPGTAGFIPPDWVMVTTDGPKVLATPDPKTIGRYAYAIYDEGGLLDVNAAGYLSPNPGSSPTPVVSPVPAYKNSLAFADLTQLPTIKLPTTYPTNYLPQAQVNNLVGWRNYATAQPGGSLQGNFAYSIPAADRYNTFIQNITTGFLSVNPQPFPSPATAVSRTDQMFTSRQALLSFRRATDSSQNASQYRFSLNTLQYLTTFSRSINQPSYVPALIKDPNAPKVLQDGLNQLGGNNAFGGDSIINPSFLAIRAASAFARNDGTTSVVGEPLVLRRFALNRLSWITYRGPSALNLTDPIVTLMKAQGIPSSLLEQGTAANIYKYFGLSWDNTNHRWVYDHNSVTPPASLTNPNKAGTSDANIFPLAKIVGREPDFFELLKASIAVGSLGKHGSLPRGGGTIGLVETDGSLTQYKRDIMVDMQVLQIGANIIDQFDADNYPTRLFVWNSLSQSTGATREITGIENLPYLYRIHSGCVRLQEPPTVPGSNPPQTVPTTSNADNSDLAKTGAVALLFYPELWNPHDKRLPGTGVNPATGASATGMSPTSFQVQCNSTDPEHYGYEAAMNLQFTTGETFPRGLDTLPVRSPAKPVTDVPNLEPGMRTPTMSFSIPDGNQDLFREPTLLMMKNMPANADTSVLNWPDEVKPWVASGGLTSTIAAGANFPNTSSPYQAAGLTGTKGPFVGLLMGRSALQFWNDTVQPNGNYPVSSLIGNYAANNVRYAVTLRLQYKDAWGNFVTYNEKCPSILDATGTNILVSGMAGGTTENCFDPRTARFGMMQSDERTVAWDLANPGTNNFQTQTDRSLNDGTGAPTYMVQNDFGRGMPQSGDPGAESQAGFPAPGWYGNPNGWNGKGGAYMMPFLLTQNDPQLTPWKNNDGNNYAQSALFYADPDGVVRRGMGGYSPEHWAAGTSTPSNPKNTAGNPLRTDNHASRPIILNRPFRTVAELGNVYRDTAWKNLDFFSPESGDTALLDVFCVNDTDNPNQLMAGRVNLNTQQQPVLKAILAGAYKDEEKSYFDAHPSSAVGLAPLSNDEADKIATAYLAWKQNAPVGSLPNAISDWGGTKKNVSASNGIYSDHTGAGYGVDGGLSYNGFGKQMTSALFTTDSDQTWNIQRFRESPIRALTAVGQTRVWNLMIDVIAQTGRYPATAQNLANFVVEGEQHYWVHLAIDRYTGQVLDKQVEVVKE